MCGFNLFSGTKGREYGVRRNRNGAVHGKTRGLNPLSPWVGNAWRRYDSRRAEGAVKGPGTKFLVGFGLAFGIVLLYGILMTPRVAGAGNWPSSFSSGEAFFFYEDHIGRAVALSEYEDYDEDGSYFTDEEDGDPFFQAVFNPFGSTYEDFDPQGYNDWQPRREWDCLERSFPLPRPIRRRRNRQHGLV